MSNVPKRARVDIAATAVVRAAEHLTGWRSADGSADAVRAGHNALTAIDEAIRALHGVRSQLRAELLADEGGRVQFEEVLTRNYRRLFGIDGGVAA